MGSPTIHPKRNAQCIKYTQIVGWVINDLGLFSRATKSSYKGKIQKHPKVSASKQRIGHSKGCQWKEGIESIQDGFARETKWHKAIKILTNKLQKEQHKKHKT